MATSARDTVMVLLRAAPLSVAAMVLEPEARLAETVAIGVISARIGESAVPGRLILPAARIWPWALMNELYSRSAVTAAGSTVDSWVTRASPSCQTKTGWDPV